MSGLQRVLISLAALSLWHCAGGNSGAEGAGSSGPGGSLDRPGSSEGTGGGANTVPCPCQRFGIVLRVTVESELADDLYALRIEDWVVEPGPDGDLGLTHGTRLAARWDGYFPCYRGCPAIGVGDVAIATYAPQEPPLPACAARDTCMMRCEAEYAENGAEPWVGRSECSETWSHVAYDAGPDCKVECEQETADVCDPRPEQDYRYGEVRLTHDRDPVVFALTDLGELSVPLADLSELGTGPADGGTVRSCTQRFGDWTDLLQNAP